MIKRSLPLIIFLLLVLIGTVFVINYSRRGLSLFSRAGFTGNIYYVSNSGSDSNSGSKDSPFKTITYASKVAVAGDEIHIMSGIYKEKINLNGKKGTSTAPIVFVGESTNPAEYPILDGGDASFSDSTDAPVLKLTDSSWIVFERLKFINSSESSASLNSSHYIVFRRNIFNYHSQGIVIRTKSSHILVEHNEFYQTYPDTSTWTKLKDSKWEGGGFVSFGGSGMNVLRYNYFHHSFNAIYMSKTSTNPQKSDDANTFMYRNRFEDIVDDPYEPESSAFNHHFYENTLVNTHRMASFAPQDSGLLGPIYVYQNIQLMTKDPTGEANSGRINSAFKVELGDYPYVNGVYVFNNSLDFNYAGNNAYSIDVLDKNIKNFYHFNNAIRTAKNVFTSSTLNLTNSLIDYDLTNSTFGYTEANGKSKIDPSFVDSRNEDFRLKEGSTRYYGMPFTAKLGFVNLNVINSSFDIGAMQYGASDFRVLPKPVYVVPTGGEVSGFPQNTDWPADVRGGVNPLGTTGGSAPVYYTDSQNTGTQTSPPKTSTPSTNKPSVVKPTTTTANVSNNAMSIAASGDASVREMYPNRNYGDNSRLHSDFNAKKISYINFDLSKLQGKVIDSIKLKVYVYDGASSSTRQKVFYFADYLFNESQINYKNRPTSGGILVGNFGGGKSGNWIEVPLNKSSFTSRKNITLSIENTSDNNMSFNSSETSKSPKLEVTFH